MEICEICGKIQLSLFWAGFAPAAMHHCRRKVDYPSQQIRLILFFPDEETDKTTSTLFPQLLQHCTLFLFSARDETSVFDLTFSAISLPPFLFEIFFAGPGTTPYCRA